MSTHLVKAASGLKQSLLPKNTHAAEVTRIDAKLVKLQAALKDNTHASFTKAQAKTKDRLLAEKEKHQTVISRLNGAFYQDPKSSLKKAWDTIVNAVRTTGHSITMRSEVDALLPTLESLTDTNSLKAQSSIKSYLALEQKRDASEAALKHILEIEKTGPEASTLEHSLRTQKQALQDRQKVLCGDYYGDSRALLDQHWQKYQNTCDAGSCDASFYLVTYQTLDDERKSIDAQLSVLEQQLSLLPSPVKTLETMTTESIQTKIASLQTRRAEEAPQAGVNWKSTASRATSLAALASFLL